MKTLFQHFFKPKWQHRDPNVRKQAVQSLPLEESALIIELARSDLSSDVRLAALRRITDLALYAERIQQDSDVTVRDFAGQRLRQWLAGGREDGPVLAARLGFVQACDDAALLEYLALQAQETELRALAIAKISRESVLVEVVLHDTAHTNRLLALTRVQQPNALERIAKHARTQDKQVHRQARDRLKGLQVAEADQAHLQAEAIRLCERLESLGASGRWEQETALLRAWHEQWQALACAEPALTERYFTAYQRFTQIHAHYCQQRDAGAAALVPLREAKREHVLSCETWARELPAVIDDPAVLSSELTARLAAWQALDKLPVDEENHWQAQITAWQQAVQARLNTAQQLHAWQSAQAAWQYSYTRLLGLAALTDAAVHAWETEGKQLRNHTPDGYELPELDAPLATLRARQEQQAHTRTRLLAEIPTHLDHLEQALASGVSIQADKAHDVAKQALHQFHLLGGSEAQIHAAQKRLHALEPELHQLDAWRAWATDTVRERLIQDMEALVSSTEHPEVLAKQIHELQDQWKKLPRSQGAQTLWTRFHEAAQQAYAPCQAHFAAQTLVRQQHAEAKLGLCDRLAFLLETADWTTCDWSALQDFGRELRELWHELGPVEREQQRSLQTRFEALLTQLYAPLAAERAHNLQSRRKLIAQVQALLKIDDLRASTSECRRLQQQWRITVPGKRSEEQKLWEQFRQACDAVFARRSQAQAERQAALDSQRVAREQIISQLEQLSAVTDMAQRAEAQAQAQALEFQWVELPPLTDNNLMNTLRSQYEQAQVAWQRQAQVLNQQQQGQRWQQWADRAATARRLESLLTTSLPPEPALLEAWQAAWDALPDLEEPTAQQAFQHRVAATLTALHADETTRQARCQALEAECLAGQERVLRLEIATGVESPEELRAARMAYQMARLTQNFGHGADTSPESPETLARAAYLQALLPMTMAETLAGRIDTALQAWLAQQAAPIAATRRRSGRAKPQLPTPSLPSHSSVTK